MKGMEENDPIAARRARIILEIGEGTDTVSALARTLGVSATTVSRDVRVMRERGILSEEALSLKGDGRCRRLSVSEERFCLWIDLCTDVCSALAVDLLGRELFRSSFRYDEAMEPWDNLERIKGQMLALAEEKRMRRSVFRVAVRMPASFRSVELPEGRFDLAVYEDGPFDRRTAEPVKIFKNLLTNL